MAIMPIADGNSLSQSRYWNLRLALVMNRAMEDQFVLQSERLVLRRPRLSDFDRLAAMWAQPSVVTHFGGKPFNREDSWSRLLRYVGHWELMGYGMWTATLRGDDLHMGDVGFLHGERTDVPAFGCPEAGWSFHPEAQGQGLGSEAVALILEWADAQAASGADPRFARTVAMINPANAASIAVARRCGYAIFGEATYRAEPVGLWQRFRTPS
jgi:RimJ/RimL family protein N-acetyltransferase